MIALSFVGVAQTKQTSMTHILKNENLEIHIDLPLSHYHFSRFDWTGKITSVIFKSIPVTGHERLETTDENVYGKGLYNEFGIEKPVGYDGIKDGEWFHKIGVGLLKKEEDNYLFSKDYEIDPANFEVTTERNKMTIICTSGDKNGYSYVLKKEIVLSENSFKINYHLQNTGKHSISTDEYCHNFLRINNELLGSQYILKFPFSIKPALFNATVNPENKVVIDEHEITFTGTPNEQIFFSNLSGNESVDASWELINTKSKIGIRETGSFKTKQINLWGWKHVISPELFFEINVTPGKEIDWSRTYNVFEID